MFLNKLECFFRSHATDGVQVVASQQHAQVDKLSVSVCATYLTHWHVELFERLM